MTKQKELNVKSLRVAFIVFVVLLMCGQDLQAWPIPDTGQTQCYPNYSSCLQPGEPYYGQDSSYSINHPSYTKLDEEGFVLPDNATTWAIVRDNYTGCVWEMKNNKDNVVNYENPHDADNIYTWYDGSTGISGNDNDTMDFINALNIANYGGYSDWRLPTPAELLSIADFSGYIPAINQAYFPDTAPGYFWTSTTYANGSSAAMTVYFNHIDISARSKEDYSYVRAVRGGYSLNNFVNNNDGTITDISTGLMWQQATAPGTYSWEQALAYCENLEFSNYSDWRLPTVKELQSILDDSRFAPAIDNTIFNDTVSYHYWTSTSHSDYLAIRYVNFETGRVFYGDKAHSKYVRAVRLGQSKELGGLDIRSFTADPQSGQAPLEVYFICDAKNDNGSIIEYLWDFDGDGINDAVTNDNNTKNLYIIARTFYASVIAVNDTGLKTRSHTIEIMVADPSTSISSSSTTSSVQPTTTTIAESTTTTQPITTTIEPNTTSTVISTSSSTTTTGLTSTSTTSIGCIDNDGDGYGVGPMCGKAQDCNDSDKQVHPDAVEVCWDGIDNNCNFLADEDCDAKKCPFENLLGDGNPKLKRLRSFRDNTLAGNAIGRKIILIYYNNADILNAVFDRSPALRAAARRVLEALAVRVGRAGMVRRAHH